MRDLNTQKGFTLVELAIVMTIIGLLIGGILKGQELMQNARVTATIAQVRSYEAATTTFRDKYEAIPGDMKNADARLPNCIPAAECGPTSANAGDGIVGVTTWTGTPAAAIVPWPTQTPGVGSVVPASATAVGAETYLFWTHLLQADLISGVTNAALTSGSAFASGTTHPAAKIGGVFIAGFGSGGKTPGNPVAAGVPGPSGLILALVASPTSAVDAVGATQILTPTRAAQIDRKMDDGRPDTGYVQAFGLAANCFGGAAPYAYQENQTTLDCGLVFRIQG